MRKVSHTPGPWGYQDPMGPEILSIVTNPGGEAYEWVHVAQIGTDPVEGEEHVSFEEHEANARLIAAAPELLGALQAMMSERFNGPDGETIWRQAEAAVAKAEGGP